MNGLQAAAQEPLRTYPQRVASVNLANRRADLLSPSPQLFPDLDQFLHRTSAGNAIIHHAAAGVRRVIGLTRGSEAEARQAAAKLPDFVGRHDFL